MFRLVSHAVGDQMKRVIDHGRGLVPAKLIEVGKGNMEMASRRFRLLLTRNAGHRILLVGAEESGWAGFAPKTIVK
jgi:hypothetical protein